MGITLIQILRIRVLLKLTLLLGAVVYPLSMAISATNKDCLTFIAQDNDVGREVSINFSEALNKQNICHTIDFFPEKRADFLFRDKKYDGFVARVGVFLRNSPVAVRQVGPSVIQATGVILSRSDKIKSVKDLEDNSIGIIRGWLWMEKMTASHRNTVQATSIIGLTEMFLSENVDTILMPQEALFVFGLENYFQHTVADLQVYIYLKTGHDDMGDRISKAIKHHLKSGNTFYRMPF